MNQVFADTGYWIALLNPRDELHERARATSVTAGKVRIVTSEWVLTELLNSFAERGDSLRAAAARTVSLLRERADITVVPFTDAPFQRAFDLFQERRDKDWSITDCSSFLTMRRLGITAALSYDRHFEQAGFKALLRTGDLPADF